MVTFKSVIECTILMEASITSRFESRIYKILSKEPMTASEVAKRAGVNYKTAQRVLMLLALTKNDVKYRNSGRIHLFWVEPTNKTYSQKLDASHI